MDRSELSAAEFQELYGRLKRMCSWGPADRRGALNNISSAELVAAASDVWVGRTVSLGAPAESGLATTLSSNAACEEIVGRGLLLDIARLRGVPWLEPGEDVTADDLVGAEHAQVVRIGQGDVLFLRVGDHSNGKARAGLHPTALELIAERRVAALGSDGNNDTAGGAVEGVDLPVHVLAINAMGLPLVDYLRFDGLVALCEQLRRWSFLCVIAPLRLGAGTGSPVNPIAIF